MKKHVFIWTFAICFMVSVFSSGVRAATVAEALTASEAQAVSIEGEVTALRASWKDTAPNLLTVRDGTGEILVAIWPDQFAKVSPAPAVGSHVAASGVMKPYNGAPQIKIEDGANLKVTAPSAAPTAAPAAMPTPAVAPAAPGVTPIQAIREGEDGQFVAVEGEVVKFKASWQATAPNTLTLRDDGGEITVVMWPDAFNKLGSKPAVGARVRAEGEVNQYRGVLQIKVGEAGDLQVLDGVSKAAQTHAPTPAATPETAPAPQPGGIVRIGDVTSEMQEQEVAFVGVIREVKAARGEKLPNLITIDDGAGKATLVIWPSVYAEIKPPLAVGAHIKAKGVLGGFHGQRQLRIRNAADLTPAP